MDSENEATTPCELPEAVPALADARSEAELLSRVRDAAADLFPAAEVDLYAPSADESPSASTDARPAVVRDALAAGETVVGERDGRTELGVPIGSSRVLVFTASPDEPLSDRDAALASLLGQTAAATLDRMAHADVLDDRESALERKDERFDRLAGLLAHEFRNPVGIASGHLDLVVGLDADERHLEAVRAAVDRMDRLTESLLDLIRGEPLPGNTDDVDVGYLARDVFERVAPPTATLSTAGSIAVRANERRLRTALERLFEEVVDRAGSSVSVRVGALPDGGFYVADDGPARERDVDVDPFAYRPSRDIDRRDLRLAIVRDVALAHGWRVAVAGEPDDGARIELGPDLEGGSDPDFDSDAGSETDRGSEPTPR